MSMVKYRRTMAAIGKRKTSVFDKKGRERYPKCVMYQYQLSAPAYIVFATKSGSMPSPKATGSAKNCSPSACSSRNKLGVSDYVPNERSRAFSIANVARSAPYTRATATPLYLHNTTKTGKKELQ